MSGSALLTSQRIVQACLMLAAAIAMLGGTLVYLLALGRAPAVR